MAWQAGAGGDSAGCSLGAAHGTPAAPPGRTARAAVPVAAQGQGAAQHAVAASCAGGTLAWLSAPLVLGSGGTVLQIGGGDASDCFSHGVGRGRGGGDCLSHGVGRGQGGGDTTQTHRQTDRHKAGLHALMRPPPPTPHTHTHREACALATPLTELPQLRQASGGMSHRQGCSLTAVCRMLFPWMSTRGCQGCQGPWIRILDPGSRIRDSCRSGPWIRILAPRVV